MEGSPILRAFGVLLCVLGLSWPLKLLTSRNESFSEGSAVVAQEEDGKRKRESQWEITFSRPARFFELRQYGTVLWRVEAPGGREARKLEVDFPAEGTDFQFAAEFEGGEVSAVRFKIEVEGGEAFERSLWGGSKLEGVVSVP